MNIYVFPILIAFLLNFCLAIFILIKNSRCVINRTFAFWNFCVGIWNLGAFLIYASSSYQEAFFSTRFILVNGLFFIPSSFFHFVLVFTENKKKINKTILQAGYFSSLFFLTSNIIGFPLIGKELTKYYWGYYPKICSGDLYFGIIFVFFTIYSLYLLYNSYKKSIGYKSNRMKYVFWGSLIGFIGGSTNFLPLYGIRIYPIGNIANCVYSLSVAYAIIEFRLIDINIVFKKGLVYSCWLFLVGLSYLMGFFVIKEMAYIHKINATFTLTLISLILFLGFFSIRKKLENFLETILFKNKYNYQVILKNFTTSLLTILELEELIPLIVTTIYKTMHLTSCSLILYDQSKDSYAFKYLEGLKKNNRLNEIQLTHQNRLVQYFNKHNFILLQEEIERNMLSQRKSKELQQLHQDLLFIQAKVCVPLYMNNKLIGLLNLGNKQSGDLFNREDLKLLTTLANQSAIAISNAQSIKKIKKQQEWIAKNEQLAIIGQLSNEMFHELNKSLTKINITGHLLKSVSKKNTTKDLNIIEKEVKRATKIVKGFSVFSKKDLMDKHLFNINKLIEDSLDFLAQQISKNKIKIIRQLESDLPEIKINPILIEQMFINIIENSIHAVASTAKKTIIVKTFKPCFSPQQLLFSTPTIVIEITDTGCGIAKENIDKIFNPFYTTKESQSGAGLGLNISSRIIEQHQGNINVKSVMGQGTKMVISLPLSENLLNYKTDNILRKNMKKIK
ncbi:GAF domain-containing protein [bacterium]|nr:GAF domain-containing protein [bacterium]